MKKILLALPLVVGASWTGASYYTGAQTQSAYDRLLVQLNDLKPLTLVNESYTSGFMTSSAVTKVMESSAPDAQVLFRLRHEIKHSPVAVNEGNLRVGAASITTTLLDEGTFPDEAKEFLSGFVNSEPFVIDTEVSFGGDTDTRLQVSPYQYNETGFDFSFGGLDYLVAITGDAIEGTGSFGEVSAVGGGLEMKSAPGVITADLTRVGEAIFTGTSGIEFESMYMKSEKDPSENVALTSVSLLNDVSASGDLLSGKATLSVKEIESVLPVNRMSMEMAVDNLSAKGVEDYIRTISQFSSSELLLSEDSEIFKTILTSYVSMIGSESGVDVKFDLNNDGGDAKVGYGISVINDTLPAFPAGGLSSITTVRELINVLKVEVRLDADAAAIDQTPLAMFMSSPMAQQYIVADGSSYKSNITLSEMIVDINGNPMSLEMMVPGEVLNMPLSTLLSSM